jgi:hypothetical protein
MAASSGHPSGKPNPAAGQVWRWMETDEKPLPEYRLHSEFATDNWAAFRLPEEEGDVPVAVMALLEDERWQYLRWDHAGRPSE